MNKVILCGRLTADPEIRRGDNNETTIARYSLAVDRRQKRDGNSEVNADFPRCVTFGKGAEFAEKWLRKGTKVIITGHIQTSSYTNRDGQKVFATDIIVEEHEFAESKRMAEQYNHNQPQNTNNDFMDVPKSSNMSDVPF